LFATITALVLSGVTWPLAIRQKRQARMGEFERSATPSMDFVEKQYVCEADIILPWSTVPENGHAHFALGLLVSEPELQAPMQVSSPRNESRSVIPWRQDLQSCHPSPAVPAAQATQVILANLVAVDQILEESPEKGIIASSTTPLIRKPDLMLGGECKASTNPSVGLLPWHGSPVNERAWATPATDRGLIPFSWNTAETALMTIENSNAKSLNPLTKPTGRQVRVRAPIVGFVVLFGESTESGSYRRVMTIESYDLDDEMTLCARVARVA